MQLYLYNTLTRQKEEFIPIVPRKVGMYSCGPTVYWTPSIGNYRATFTADLLRNVFQLFGYEVTSVMNITDVGHLVGDWDQWEDKLEKWSKRDWLSAWDVAKRYEEIFKAGMKKLNIEPFTYMPRATDHIQEQIALVKTLEEKWYTYQVDWDGIYMDTSKVENYGELMGPNYKKRIADLQAGERVDMGGKKNPTDFALWKFSPTDEKRQMERPSPRGVGFPGWHIECSAMSSKYLGEQFDLHHWWSDHITIHHPNEIAQSECAFGHHPWVKYRVHNEFLNVDGWKMWKSLGNAWTLEDIESRGFSPLDLRYFYFMAQFGNFQNFTWDQLEVAKNSRKALMKKVQQLEKSDIHSMEFDQKIIEILSDNLNTPKLFAEIHDALNSGQNIYGSLLSLDQRFLKLGLFDVEEDAQIPAEIETLAQQRIQAKADKNYALADELRNQITALGYVIKDVKSDKGYEIEKA